MMKMNLRVCLLVALAALAAPVAAESNFTAKLDAYAKTVVTSSKPGTFSYLKSKQTMATPLVSHLATFSTNDAIFHSNPKAATDRGAYMDNTARRIVWEAKFCSTQLKDLMRNERVNIVTGEIVNREGETQFMAVCPGIDGADNFPGEAGRQLPVLDARI